MQSNPLTIPLNTFAFQLYQKLSQTVEDGSDILLSPVCLFRALATLVAGANGDTQIQLKQALFKNGSMANEKIHSNFGKLVKALNSLDIMYEFHMQSRLYVNASESHRLQGPFAELIKVCYGTELQPMDFTSPYAEHKINDWIREATKDKIQDILSPGSLQEGSSLLLVSASYLKSYWSMMILQMNTHKQKFYVSESTYVQVDMMHPPPGDYLYTEDDLFQVLGIPYISNKVVMYMLLPKNRCALQQSGKNMSVDYFSRLTQKCEEKLMQYIAVPKFELEQLHMLTDTLRNLGLTNMSDPSRADFSGINGEQNLFLWNMLQKASIRIQESDAEESPVTIGYYVDPEKLSDKPCFVADHPFLFAVVDRNTSLLLFLGRFSGPSYMDGAEECTHL